MRLNTNDGVLEIDSVYFNAETSYNEIEQLQNKYKIEISTSNNQSKSYRILNMNKGDTTLLLLFYANKLCWINIFAGDNYNFPPFEVMDEEKQTVKKILNTLGGERNYMWGSVEFNDDNKGGSVSVLVKYNIDM